MGCETFTWPHSLTMVSKQMIIYLLKYFINYSRE
jgi:hypothetical protein